MASAGPGLGAQRSQPEIEVKTMENTTDTNSIHTAMPTLKGKRVFITGGTTGIGRAIANLLGSEGAEIFICGRHQPELNDALEKSL